MTKTVVQYIENGKVSTVWNRIIKSKTALVVALFVLAKAEVLFRDNSWQTLDAWRAFLPYVFGGAALILIRSAIKKVELASNAANPVVNGIYTFEEAKRPASAGINLFTLFMLGGLMVPGCLLLSGCDATKALVGADGKPVVMGEVCVQTANGMFCYKPNEPTVVEPAPAPVPAVPTPAAPSRIPPPLEK